MNIRLYAMSSVNVLFYSKKCEGSTTLMRIMENEKLLKFFNLICTDNNPDIPPQIKFTPTLILKDVPVPYVAGDAFAWLNKMKQMRINNEIKKMNEKQKQHFEKISNVMNKEEETSILEFSKEEMGDTPDLYSYLDYDDAIQHSYFDCKNLGKEAILTPKDKSEKMSESEYKKLQGRLKNERSKQDTDFKRSIESFKIEMSRK